MQKIKADRQIDWQQASAHVCPEVDVFFPHFIGAQGDFAVKIHEKFPCSLTNYQSCCSVNLFILAITVISATLIKL